jgi:thiol-disulfide isomerase/thioredoxin
VAAVEPAISSLTKFKFTTHAMPRPVAPLTFVDDAGHRRTLEDFRGKLVLLNVWATWCPPCREEMPTLDRLQQHMGGSDFAVVPLSIDAGDGGVSQVRQFYRTAGVTHLPIFDDSTGTAADTVGTVGLPTTLLIDRDGREIGRTIGPADWSSPEVAALIRGRLGRPATQETQ